MTGATSLQSNWTTVGASVNRGAILAAIETLKWKPWQEGSTFSGMGGLNIAECIRELRIPRVTECAESPAMSPFGFYGIHAHYVNGEAWIYILDEGVSCCPVLSVFDPKEWTLVPKDHPAFPKVGGRPVLVSSKE